MNRAAYLATLLLALGAAAIPEACATTITISSPSRRAAAIVERNARGEILWSATWRGRAVLSPAPIGLRFEGEPLQALTIAWVERHAHDGMVIRLIGKASRARDRYTEAVLHLSGGARPLQLVVRAYDDGVAYRWRFDTTAPFALADERAGFGLAASDATWAMPVPGFQSSYEGYYRAGPLATAVPGEALVALPLLARHGAAWIGITEAALHDWAGMYLVRRADAPGLTARLSPRLDRPGVAVTGGAGRHLSPWRVAMLGDAPGRLVESNLVTLLNPPRDARDWSWVRPGKTSFPWWNDYVWPGARFRPGLNTATMLAYIDFDADHGIPFHTLDGFEGQAWYGGPIEPNGTPQDLTRATSAIDLPAVLAHARRRGVGIRLWCHWKPLRAQLDTALAQWARWGVEGIMIDFMDRDDQEMVAFRDEVARKAAAYRLTVVFHGTSKPTGEGRTWPNVLTHEAVRGTEYNKFPENPGSTPTHEVTTPFVRMLAGPMDIHEGGFDAVAPAAFANRNTAPRVIGTRARALATYVIEENPLAMVADTPVNYRDATGFDFVVHTPTTWDETRVLAGEVGSYLVVARRKGDRWWLGAATNGAARTVTVRLPTHPDRRWQLDGYVDAGTTRNARRLRRSVAGGSTLTIEMAPAGGFAARLSPLPSPVRLSRQRGADPSAPRPSADRKR